MKRLGLVVLIGLFTWQVPFTAVAFNTKKVAQDNYEKIKQLKKSDKRLLGSIEQLQEHQKFSRQKITELFHLMEYKKSRNVVKETILRVREEDRKAKKVYTNARSLLVTGQYNQAIDLFLNYLDLYPENNHVPDAFYWLGRAYVAKEDHHNGKKIFIEFQNDYPLHHKFSNSLYELAMIHHELKETKEAEKLLKSMIKKFPNHNSIIQAKALLKSNQAPEIVADTESALKKIKAD